MAGRVKQPQLPADPVAREEAILRRRADLAAISRAELRDPEARLLLFRVAGENYAVDLSKVSAITLIRAMTPLPGVPRALAGLLNVRGRNVTAIDLALFLGGRIAKSRRIVDAGKAITVTHEGREIALIAEELSGIREVFAGEVRPVAGATTGDPVKSVGPDGVHILDVAALFQDARLVARAARGSR